MFNEEAVFFCGTILAIARTGNYPASLVFGESGLSSNLPLKQICNYLANSLIYLVYDRSIENFKLFLLVVICVLKFVIHILGNLRSHFYSQLL